MKFALSIASLFVLGLSAYGCSDDAATGDDDGDDDGGTSSSSSSGGSSSGGGSSSSSGGSSSSSSSGSQADGGGACFVAADGVPYSTKNQLAHSGDCTQAQLEAFNTACVVDTSTDETCAAFQEANGPCNACILGDGDDAATRVTGYFGADGEISPVCPANVAGNPAECGTKADNFAYCVSEACGSCEDQATFDTCIAQAAGVAPCNAYVPAVDCDALFTTNATAITATCGDGDVANFDNVYKFAIYMCGPAAQ